MRLVRVAVPVPALDSLTYSLPDEFPEPAIGARVLVPLGTRVLTGCVVGRDDGTPPDNGRSASSALEMRPVIDVLDADEFLPAEIVALSTWVAEYYMCGIGEALAAAMPPRAWIASERHVHITPLGLERRDDERGQRREVLQRLRPDQAVRVERVDATRGRHAVLLALERDGLVVLTHPLRGRASAFRQVRTASITAQGLEVAQADAGTRDRIRLGPRQEEALVQLAGAPDGIDTAVLARGGIGPQTLARLSTLGLASIVSRRIDRDPFDVAVLERGSPGATFDLTPEQRAALDRLVERASAGRFHTTLLHGVTGSGKTEIYLRLAAEVRRQGRGVLLLVPEIALTPAVAGAFRASFGERVAIQHSGLSDGERHDQWHRIRRGDVDVVVGTRSAVFAPLTTIGLILVDEEHDGSYKQEESPRYNARDVAVVRAREADALVVLGSATPSMESYQNALNGRYALVSLERRVLDRPLAAVRIVNMRDEYAASGPDVILSAALCEGLGERLAKQEQAIVLLNRRGFASAIFCRQCAATLECPNCSVSLTVHRAIRRARCHYCNFSMAIPVACANCAGPYLEQVGFGTERVEAEIVARFPAARVARVDRDTVRRRGAIARLLTQFSAREIDVLVGTQMIAKGHDFARVSLVGVISADVGLGLADFRAAERTFQLLTQVAGRAGRGEIRGEAIIQTLYPDHYSIRHACRQDFASFFAEEIAFRRAMRYPPAVALINVVVKGRTQQGAMQDAGDLVRTLRSTSGAFRVLGPAPAALSRLKGEHRAQFFMKGTHRGTMKRALLGALQSRADLKRRTIADVDPMSVL